MFQVSKVVWEGRDEYVRQLQETSNGSLCRGCRGRPVLAPQYVPAVSHSVNDVENSMPGLTPLRKPSAHIYRRCCHQSNIVKPTARCWGFLARDDIAPCRLPL